MPLIESTIPTLTARSASREIVTLEQAEEAVHVAKQRLRRLREQSKAQERERKLRAKAEKTAIETLERLTDVRHSDDIRIQAAHSLLQITDRLG